MAKDNVTRRISIYVNGKEVENSLKGVEGAMSHVRNKMRLLNEDSETYDKDSKELAQTMSQLKEKQSQYREELGLTNKTMQQSNEMAGGLRSTLTGIWSSLTSGDLQGAKEGISSLTSGMGGLLKSTMAFLASPIGLISAGLVGLAKGAKDLFDYNREMEELNYQLEALGVNSKEISKVRSEILATAETFDKEFKDIAEKADSLSQSYGISISEANKLIADGLAEGGAYNDEFLDSIGEYDVFFQKAGYSAKEFIDIINTGYDLGIYSDKLPDALKEADLALKENNKSTRDALVNAFGASFSDEILNKVKTGEITTKQALESIAKKSEETQLSQQQYAQLTADVFKGAGEDVGGAAVVLQAVGEAANRETDKLGTAYKELTEANERLNKAQADLFEIEGFGDLWTGIKVVAIQAWASILEYISIFKKDFQPVIDLVGVVFVGVWSYLKFNVVAVFEVIGGVVKTFFSFFGGIVQAITKLLKGDFRGAFQSLAEGIGNSFKHIGNVFKGLYNNVIQFLSNLIGAAAPILETLGVDVDKLKSKLEGLKSKKFEIKGEIKVDSVSTNSIENKTFGSGGGGASAEALAAAEKERQKAADKLAKERERQKKLDEDAAKKALEIANALASAKANLAKQELDNYIFNLRSKLDKEKQLTPQIIEEETDRLQSVLNAKLEYNEKEKAHKIEEATAKAKSEEELLLLKKAIDLEYLTSKQELELTFQKSTDDLKNQYEEEQKILKAEQLAIENELAIATADSDFEVQRIKEEQRLAAELKRYDDLLAAEKISKEQHEKFVVAASEQSAKTQLQINLQNTQNILGAMSTLADAMISMFGQSKEAARAQAIINGAMAITTIWASQGTGNAIADFVIKSVQSIAVATTTARQLQNINKEKAPKKAKFFYGGYTGDNAALGTDEYGPVTGYVHKNEYVIPEVMTQDPQFANTIGWLEHNRQRKLKGFVDGGSVEPTSLVSQSVNNSGQSDMLTNTLMALQQTLASGIKAKSYIGYEEQKKLNTLNDDLLISEQNGIL